MSTPKNTGLQPCWLCTCRAEILVGVSISFHLGWHHKVILHLGCDLWVELPSPASGLTCYFLTNSAPKGNNTVSGLFCCCKLTEWFACSAHLNSMGEEMISLWPSPCKESCPYASHEDIRWCVTASLILNLRTRWRLVVSFIYQTSNVVSL
jgi:hypothetical protein